MDNDNNTKITRLSRINNSYCVVCRIVSNADAYLSYNYLVPIRKMDLGVTCKGICSYISQRNKRKEMIEWLSCAVEKISLGPKTDLVRESGWNARIILGSQVNYHPVFRACILQKNGLGSDEIYHSVDPTVTVELDSNWFCRISANELIPMKSWRQNHDENCVS